MQSGWLVETASLWAYHGSMIVDARQPLPTPAVNDYWIRNRSRFEAWSGALTKITARLRSPSVVVRVKAWHNAQRLVHEVLMAEPLARITAAVAVKLEDRQVDSDSRAILHNVFVSHEEARNRCLKLIVQGIERGNQEAEELNCLRHYLEHWTDLLIGLFGNERSAEHYAFSLERARDFSEDYGQRIVGEQSSIVWSILLAGNRKWMNENCHLTPMFGRLNSAVCAAATAMLQHEWFDSLGCMQSRSSQMILSGIELADRTMEQLVDGSWETSSQIVRTRPAVNRIS